MVGGRKMRQREVSGHGEGRSRHTWLRTHMATELGREKSKAQAYQYRSRDILGQHRKVREGR